MAAAPACCGDHPISRRCNLSHVDLCTRPGTVPCVAYTSGEHNQQPEPPSMHCSSQLCALAAAAVTLLVVAFAVNSPHTNSHAQFRGSPGALPRILGVPTCTEDEYLTNQGGAWACEGLDCNSVYGEAKPYFDPKVRHPCKVDTHMARSLKVVVSYVVCLLAIRLACARQLSHQLTVTMTNPRAATPRQESPRACACLCRLDVDAHVHARQCSGPTRLWRAWS